MEFMLCLVEWIACLSGQSATDQNDSLCLERLQQSSFAGDVGEVLQKGCRVIAYREHQSEPAPDAEIIYEVKSGCAEFADGSMQMSVHTDEKGIASVDIRMTEIGVCHVIARLADEPAVSVHFFGRTDGLADKLYIYVQPTFPVDPGEVELRIVALDHRLAPVLGAELVIEAWPEFGPVVLGRVDEAGNGEYIGKLKTRRAGAYVCIVQDRSTGVLCRHSIYMIPAESHSLQIIEVQDPRLSQPRDQLTVRVLLADRYGNSLDPSRIRASVEGKELLRVLVDKEARFAVNHPGYGDVPVRFWDARSDISLDYVVQFPAAALQTPGFIEVGQKFSTPIYVFFSIGKPDQGATVEIKYNPELTTFVGMETGVAGDSYIHTTVNALSDGLVIASINTKREIDMAEFPDGICIGTAIWECRGEGESCFELAVRMSPLMSWWKQCVKQKLKETKTICVNIIYPPANLQVGQYARRVGDIAAARINDVISSKANLERCCPNLQVAMHHCSLTPEEWDKVNDVRKGDDNTHISTNAEVDEILKIDISCRLEECINIRMFSFSIPRGNGRRQTGIARGGEIICHPPSALTNPNVLVHEVAHALGIADDQYEFGPDGSFYPGPPGNLMSSEPGNDLTEEQCEEISANIGKFLEK